MAGRYRAQSILLADAAQDVGASADAQVVSKEFDITAAGGTRALRIDVETSGVTKTTGITVELQHSHDRSAWLPAHASAAKFEVTEDGPWWLALNAADSTTSPVFPLLPFGRVVVTTGTGDAVTIDDVRVCQEE